MTQDASAWLSSDYNHLDLLTSSDLAWEWLRRNEAYDRDFQALAAGWDDPFEMTEHIRQCWGLRFPR